MGGQHADGHDHAIAAAAAGAVAIIAERPIDGLGAPLLQVRDGRAALAQAAAWRADFPSRELGIVGITGTDGKTTTGYLVRALLEGAGYGTGFIGTTDVVIGGDHLGNEARTTTPEAPELQGHLAAMRAAGDRWAVVEATSHGLAQQRVGAVEFDVAVLTNVTSEHLEFHGSLAAYQAAKRRLFSALEAGPDSPAKPWGRHAVINLDDAIGADYAAAAKAAGAEVIGYGLAGQLASVAAGHSAEVTALALDEGPGSMVITMRTPDWEGPVRLRLAGRFNVYNALAAMAVGHAVGLDAERSATSLAALEAVPGRMHRIDQGQPFTVVVDYAHTADSLAKVLDELAPVPRDGPGLIAVFGSAGERDRQKRPEMGRVAGERCRLVILTDEDPRGEDRHTILEDIAAGAESVGRVRGKDLIIVPDRTEAIALALASAGPGDSVLLAGKGHERTIERASGDQAWDEAGTAIGALAALGYER
jgi:UDP-N-acetylmuramoyl-L-alanyl-D-glutamate--2,6-diaminopimelate ligase